MKKLLSVAAVLLPLAAAAQYDPAAPPPSSPPPYQPAPGYQPPPPGYQPSPGYQPAPGYGPMARPFGRRSPWYIGFGLGGASGNVSAWGNSGSLEAYTQEPWASIPATPPSATNVALNFKVGVTLTERLLLGFDITGVGSLVSQGDISTQTTIANYDAMATYFPMGEGLFVRGGVGLTRLTVDWKDSLGSGSDSIGGFNGLVGAGYAFWLGQTFNLTVNLDYSAQSYGSASYPETLANGIFMKPRSSNFLAFWVGFDWY